MRKAVQAARLKGRSSGRSSTKSGDERDNMNGGSGGPGSGENGMLGSMAAPPKLRKTTPEEAALTAKNYRLAKELSELRVRHREECKNVTRLTMENMNLASRCREAISHVAMLKKDLATSQRRTAEVIHNYQRHSQQNGGGVQVARSSQQSNGMIGPDGPVVRSSSEKVAAAAHQPSPRAIHVARDLEQMDELLNASPTKASSSNNHHQPPPAVVVAGVSPQQQPEKSPRKVSPPVPPVIEAASVPTAAVSTSTTASTTPPSLSSGTTAAQEVDPEALSEPVDSDDFEDVYNQADDAVPTPRSTPRRNTGAPPLSPHSKSTAAAAKVDHASDEDDDDEDVEGEDADVVGETTTTTGHHSSKTSAFFPHSASPKIGRGGYNEEFPGDITAVRKPALRSRRPMLGGFSEQVEDDETGNGNNNGIVEPPTVTATTTRATAGVFDNKAMVAARSTQDKSTMSSIDAFEASFRTDFPDNFSPRDGTVAEEKKSSSGDGAYNPFFPSPKKGRPGSESRVSADATGPPRTGFVAALVAASKENSQEQQQQHGASPSPKPIQLSRLDTSSGSSRHRSKDPPGKDRTSPRSLIQSRKSSTSAVVTNSPKKSTSAGKNEMTHSSFAASPRISSSPGVALQRRSAPVTPTMKSPLMFGKSSANSSSSTPTTPGSPARSSPTNEPGSSGSANAAAGGIGEPKRPEKTGYDLARLRYEKALAHRKTRGPNSDAMDNSSGGSSNQSGGSDNNSKNHPHSHTRRSSDGDFKPAGSTTPKENKNNANGSGAAAATATDETTVAAPPQQPVLTPKSSSRAGSASDSASSSLPPPPFQEEPKASQTDSGNTATATAAAPVAGGQALSVRDRLSLFSSDRTPRSPEKEAARLQAIANGRRLDLDMSYEDEGDIPLVTSINRKSSTATSSDNSNSNGRKSMDSESTNATPLSSSSSSGPLARNNPFLPKSPGNNSGSSSGVTSSSNGYISGGGANNSYSNNASTNLTRHRPWDHMANTSNNAGGNDMSADPMADPNKISSTITNADSTFSATINNSTGGPSSKPRRSVAQPVSYAEPSLRSKLRNGDSYFPKDDGKYEGAFYSNATTATSTAPAATATTANDAGASLD